MIEGIFFQLRDIDVPGMFVCSVSAHLSRGRAGMVIGLKSGFPVQGRGTRVPSAWSLSGASTGSALHAGLDGHCGRCETSLI